jgi:hypothetical protein
VRAVRKYWINLQLPENMLPYFEKLPTSRREICDSAPPLQHAVRDSGSRNRENKHFHETWNHSDGGRIISALIRFAPGLEGGSMLEPAAIVPSAPTVAARTTAQNYGSPTGPMTALETARRSIAINADSTAWFMRPIPTIGAALLHTRKAGLPTRTNIRGSGRSRLSRRNTQAPRSCPS